MHKLIWWRSVGAFDGVTAKDAPAVTDGLVAFFPIDEGSGTEIHGYWADGYPIDYVLNMDVNPAQRPAWLAAPGLQWDQDAQLTGSGTALVFPSPARTIIIVGSMADLGGPTFGHMIFKRPTGQTVMNLKTGVYPTFSKMNLTGFQNSVNSTANSLSNQLNMKSVRIAGTSPYAVRFASGATVGNSQNLGAGPAMQVYEDLDVYHVVSSSVTGYLYYLILYNRFITDEELVTLYTDVQAKMAQRDVSI